MAFVLLPYRVDLYIIPCDLHYVNTFFVTFLTFFRETLGLVEKETCLIIAFIGIKISSKNLKKVRFSTEKLQNLRKKMPFLQKKFQDFFALNSFFLLYFLTAIRKNQKMGSLSSFGVFKPLTSWT